MSFTRIITLAAVAAFAVPTVATAAERPPATGADQSIIAVLIGFTPPIGTDHGSVVPR